MGRGTSCRWANAAALDRICCRCYADRILWRPAAVSRSGAIGLFQVMPFHFHQVKTPITPIQCLTRYGLFIPFACKRWGKCPAALAGYMAVFGVIARGEGTWAAADETLCLLWRADL